MLTAITTQHFAFVTNYVAHFIAQSLLLATVAITRILKKCVTWARQLLYVCNKNLTLIPAIHLSNWHIAIHAILSIQT